MYKVSFTKKAYSNYEKLGVKHQRLASKAIDRLSEDPKLGKPLKGELKGLRSLRFSRYRIVYEVEKRKLLIVIFDIDHRKRVYKVN